MSRLIMKMNYLLTYTYYITRPVVAQGHKLCDCKIDWLWIRLPLEMKYLFKFIFPFLRSSVEAKCGVEFRLSIRNASRKRRKVGNRVC